MLLTWDDWQRLSEDEKKRLEQLKAEGKIVVTPINLVTAKVISAK